MVIATGMHLNFTGNYFKAGRGINGVFINKVVTARVGGGGGQTVIEYGKKNTNLTYS